jgi:hypothetical protein
MMNGKNQYLCDHCGRPCYRSKKKFYYGSRISKVAYWQYCSKNCNTSYVVTPKGTVIRKVIKVLDPKNSNIEYSVDFKYQKTLIARLTKKIVKERILRDDQLIMDFPYIVNGITPTNFYDKMKTYILFS